MSKPDQWAELKRTLISWAKEQKHIRALLWFGSDSIGTRKIDSDLDFALVFSDLCHREDVLQELIRMLNPVFSLARANFEKWSFFRGSKRLRVDVTLAGKPEDLDWLADSMEVPAPRLVPGFIDHSDTLMQSLLERANRPAYYNIQERIHEEIVKFVDGFEACSLAHARSDAYRFYFEYNLSLHRLVRLISIARGRAERLYLPVQISNTLLELEERQSFIDLKGTLYLRDGNEAKRRLLAAFEQFMGEISVQYPELDLDLNKVLAFLQSVFRRDLMHNFRDVADYLHPAIPRNRLFRSSAVCRSVDTDLIPWLEHFQIGHIIDLRTNREQIQHPYSGGVLQTVTHHPLPVEIVGEEFSENLTGKTYIKAFRGHLETYAQALQIVFSYGNQGVLVHCAHGVDRTGIFFALIGMLLECPQDAIIEDYARSSSVSDPTPIIEFMEHIQDPRRLLSELVPLGVTQDLIDRFKTGDSIHS